MAILDQSTSQTNLTNPLSSFIGREADLRQVRQRLAQYRLVTLTGPGGCGKTRLAQRLAADLLPVYPDGVWFVELAILGDPALIPQAVASALGVREQPDRDLEHTIHAHLADRRLLLVLDNCEHLVVGAARFVVTSLGACPHLTILATSREGLGLPGEALWEVPPLSLPDPRPWRDPASARASLDHFRSSESVQLFLARVAAFDPHFTLTVETGPWIAEICRRLDGMPLAIELAAARLRTLSVRQIAERLDDRFNLLSDGSRTAPLHQQTLAATLDWSDALLTEPERRVMQRLAVFAGSASLAAAEAVCASETVSPGEVLGLLSHLVDKSLVIADRTADQTRFHLLETIRQYALQKLAQRRAEPACRDSHLDYFVRWAEALGAALFGPDPQPEIRQFELEHDNLRAALDWAAADASRAHLGLRLAAACGFFWASHSYFREGRQRLAAALAPPQARDRSAARAEALVQASHLAYLQADYPAGQPLVEQALEIWRELGQPGLVGLAHALYLYSSYRMEVGDYPTAVHLYQESLDLFSQLGDIGWMGETYTGLGWCAIRTGDYALAQTHLEQALLHAQASGRKKALVLASSGLGEVAVRLGQYRRAVTFLEKALALSRQIGDRWLEATILGSLGWVALRQRQFTLMRDWLDQSLALRLEIGDRGGIAWCLEKLAEAVRQHGQPRQAAVIFGAAAALRKPIQSVIDPADMPEYERRLADLRAHLPADDYQTAWGAGEAQPLPELVAMALAAVARNGAVPATDKQEYQGLSRRERETAAWVAQGKSNREIARAMTVSEKTVETYVTRILNKLGYDSRVQIATWAVGKGLNGQNDEANGNGRNGRERTNGRNGRETDQRT